jgi:4-aminobutyrate aminotransferase
MSHPKIVVSPPGPKARELLRRDERLTSTSLRRFYPLVVESGRDCVVRDVDGNEYIDFNAGLSCLNVGHCHRAVVSSVKEQLEKFTHYSESRFYYDLPLRLAEQLCTVTPGKFEKRVFFSNSGTEAVEAAIKILRYHYRRPSFLAYTNASHGETLGALSLSAQKLVQRRYFAPMMPGVVHIPYPHCYRCAFNLTFPECGYGCIDFIQEHVLGGVVAPEDVAGIFFEPIQAEGCILPAPEYFSKLKRLADSFGFALVDDEAETGIGRTGRWFGIEHWQVAPEVICLSGGIASGLPLGATVCKSDVMDWEPEAHSSIFGGNPLSCAAALATLDVTVKEDLLQNAAKQGNHALQRLKEMNSQHELIGDVRGRGLMIGLELVKDQKSKAPAVTEARNIVISSFKRGLALRYSNSTITITPPLTISRELIDSGLDILDGVFKELESGR